MLLHFMAQRLGTPANLATMILLFFTYSFLGYVMECIVLTAEKKHVVINRGFVRHLPFCIIYGFGALFGYALLSPLADNLVLLFLVGALAATAFEYFTAQLQLRLFGSFWWDYTNKPFNYKGILCLESTLGWGVVALLIVRLIHHNIAGGIASIPREIAWPLALVLVTVYLLDFALSARQARIAKQRQLQEKYRLEGFHHSDTTDPVEV